MEYMESLKGMRPLYVPGEKFSKIYYVKTIKEKIHRQIKWAILVPYISTSKWAEYAGQEIR